uniref:Uncharacterized protein n=1 Tax=Anguilla anguilla TaxID=7936 RepID=A0A0E9SIJ6_ANGAN
MKSLVSFSCSFISFANQRSVFAPINCLNCDSDTAIHTFWGQVSNGVVMPQNKSEETH